nr:competence type IV pilus minor pilin ComGG [Metabacillus lacus]
MEKKFYGDSQQYYLAENLKLQAVQRALIAIRAGQENSREEAALPHGSFVYSIAGNTNEVIGTIVVTTERNHTFTSRFVYSKPHNKIIAWSEK